MNEKYNFGSFELSALTINLIIYKSFTSLPKQFLTGAGSAAFLSALISGLVSYVFIWFLPVIYRETKTSNIIELSEKYISKGFSVIVGIIISASLFFSASQALEGVGVFSLISAYPTAPFMFIALFFMTAAVFAVRRGMNAVIRVHSIIVPFCVFMTAILLPAIFRSADTNNLFPLFGNGISRVFSTAFLNISYYFDFFLIFLINPYYKNRKSDIRIIRISGAVGILINLFIILSANLILPYPISSEIKYPLYQIMKTVYFGRFFQRIDALYLFSISLSAMAYISFTVFLITYILKRVFSLSASRPLATIVSLCIIFFASVIYKNIFSFIPFVQRILEIITFLLITILPFIKLNTRDGRVKK